MIDNENIEEGDDLIPGKGEDKSGDSLPAGEANAVPIEDLAAHIINRLNALDPNRIELFQVKLELGIFSPDVDVSKITPLRNIIVFKEIRSN